MDETIITVNFNTANQNLTNLLEIITAPNYLNEAMYNYTSTSNTLTRDLEWAILQANCFCGDIDGGIIVYYDQANSRYSRYAECMFSGFEGRIDSNNTNNTIGMCARGSLQTIPAFILTKQREMYVQQMLPGPFYSFYFGLHQNNQSQWSFYNYDQTEFPISSYTNWAPGYPNGTDSCAIVRSDDGITSVWKNIGCNTSDNEITVICQGKACDASSVACCSNCMGNDVSYEKKQKIRTKHRHIMRRKLVNGRPLRTA